MLLPVAWMLFFHCTVMLLTHSATLNFAVPCVPADVISIVLSLRPFRLRCHW